MTQHIPFTQHEAILLLDAYLQTVSGNVSRKDAIANCSADLRRMAKANGMMIDDSYRNINGITFQMTSMESAFCGKTIMKSSTKLFNETVKMYRINRKEYNRMLNEAKLMADNKQTHQDVFLAWLSQHVTPSQLSELYMALLDIEQYAKNYHLIRQSLYETIDLSLFQKIKTNILHSKLFKCQHKGQMRWVTLALNYLVQYAQEQEDMSSNENENNDESKPVITAPKIKNPVVEPMIKSNPIKIVNFNIRADMAYTKPVDFSYFDERKKENTWSALYTDLCHCLIEDYPERFDCMLKESIQGTTKRWLVDEKHKHLLRSPKFASNGLYVETNRSATDLINSIRNLLIKCLIDYENVVIRYTQKSESRKETTEILDVSEKNKKWNDKKDFFQWMLSAQGMAETSCRGYISSVQSAEKYADAHKLAGTKLFGVSAEMAKETADALFTDIEFVKKNAEQNNRYRAAITKLLDYLGVNWTVPCKTRGEGIVINRRGKPKPEIDLSPYERVLTKRYPRGFRLNSPIEMKKFRKYFEIINETELTKESEYIEGIIRSCGIEHKGKVYATSNMLSDELQDELFSYIDQTFASGKSVIYFEALFQMFSEKFLDYNIYDADMLKTYISHVAGNRFYTARSYLSNEQCASSASIEDIRMCLKEKGTPMAVEELCQTLSHIPAKRINTLLGENNEFVRNRKGKFFHVDCFSVTEEELNNIADLIETEIEDNLYISGYELYKILKRKFPYLYERNAIFSFIGWRDTLKYHLGDKFSFDGNIISSKERKLSMGEVFENYGKTHDSFDLQEISLFAKNLDTIIYFDDLYQSAARVSEDQFVSRDRVRFQVKETDKILDRFCTSDYLALPQITDFGIFPEASYPWTPCLLEHYLAFHSERYELLHTGYNKKKIVGAMVKKRKQYAHFDDLITDVLAEGNVMLQKKEALDYLFDMGYIARRSYTDIESLLINARAKRNMKEK